MTIEITGPDKSSFQFPDGTPEATITAAMAEHYGPAKSAEPAPAAYDRNDPRFANQTPAAALRGVPLLGAGVNRLGSMISAAAHPLTGVGSDKATFAERTAENLAQTDAAQADFEKEHPVADAIAGGLGGTLALGGAAGLSGTVAKGIGMTGNLIPAAVRGATSGAAIGAGDAALRGGDPSSGAQVGALTGAGGVIAGKAVGKVWDAARGAFREAPVVPTRTLDVNGVEVPVRESVVTREPNASEREQKIIHGGEGPQAQTVARTHAEATDAAMGRAHDELAASLDPTGTRPAAAPMAAGEAISSEITSQEAARAAAEAQRLQGVTTEQNAIRGDLNTTGVPGVVADSPRSAAQTISESLQRSAASRATARDAAYDAVRGVQGEFNPATFQRIGNSLRDRLNTGADPVKVTDTLTPHTAEALRDLDTNVGQLRFENQAQMPLQRGPDGRPQAPPITAETIDEARKRLISMQRAANQAARSSGDMSDVRGMRRLISAFDDHVATAARTPGGFSGDGRDLLNRLGAARAAHADLKRTFSARNPQDDAGKIIEKIVGKRDVPPAALEEIAPKLFGSNTEPGGGVQTRVADRVRELFGENSPEFTALRQGLLSHMTEAAPGAEPLTHAAVAERIHKFFSGTKGVGLAQTLFSPSERVRLLTHANRMRAAADPAPEGFVEKTVAKWAGRDGGLRASPKTIVDDLVGSTGQKGTAPALVEHLKGRLSPEAMGTLKQGVWSRITEGAEGTIPWKDQKVGQRIMNFLNGEGKGLADALFTKAEREAMANIGKTHIQLLPIEGTTNPSGSGHAVARLARGAAHGILPFIGMHAGGLPGVGVALAANKGLTSAVNRNAAVRAQKLFYGPQQAARASSTAPQRFGALGGLLAADRQSR